MLHTRPSSSVKLNFCQLKAGTHHSPIQFSSKYTMAGPLAFLFHRCSQWFYVHIFIYHCLHIWKRNSSGPAMRVHYIYIYKLQFLQKKKNCNYVKFMAILVHGMIVDISIRHSSASSMAIRTDPFHLGKSLVQVVELKFNIDRD